jgi:HAD superfamily hydrolase (TIGR01490 family)
VAIAFFDLDRTLIAINSGQLWIRRELALGHLRRRQAAQAAVWMAQYSLGLARLEDTVERAISAVRGTSGADYQSRTESFYANQVRPAFRPGALVAIDAHRRARDVLVLLTSSSNYLADRAAKDLGFETVLCNRLELDASGLHTGRTTEGIVFGRGKLVAAQRTADAHGTLLAACTFYTDSYADLPVMEAVGRPVAVNPDLRLRRKARRRGWEIVDWGRP